MRRETAIEEHEKQLSETNVLAKKDDFNTLLTVKKIGVFLRQKEIFHELYDKRFKQQN